MTFVIYTSGNHSPPGFWVAKRSTSVFEGLPHLLLFYFSEEMTCVWSHCRCVPLNFWIQGTNSSQFEAAGEVSVVRSSTCFVKTGSWAETLSMRAPGEGLQCQLASW